MPGIASTAHLNENHRTLRVAHNQVYLTAAATRRAVVPLQQLQSPALQKCQRFVFGRIAFAFAAVPTARHVMMLKGTH
jgi:hypothetical protein